MHMKDFHNLENAILGNGEAPTPAVCRSRSGGRPPEASLTSTTRRSSTGGHASRDGADGVDRPFWHLRVHVGTVGGIDDGRRADGEESNVRSTDQLLPALSHEIRR
jgi:hypothetical protein